MEMNFAMITGHPLNTHTYTYRGGECGPRLSWRMTWRGAGAWPSLWWTWSDPTPNHLFAQFNGLFLLYLTLYFNYQ